MEYRGYVSAQNDAGVTDAVEWGFGALTEAEIRKEIEDKTSMLQRMGYTRNVKSQASKVRF